MMTSCTNLDLCCTNQKCSTKGGLKSIEDLKSHIKNECPFAKMQCKYCHWIVNREHINNCDQRHDINDCIAEIEDNYELKQNKNDRLNKRLQKYIQKEKNGGKKSVNDGGKKRQRTILHPSYQHLHDFEIQIIINS